MFSSPIFGGSALPPIIMLQWKMIPFNNSFLSFGVVFHFHDCGSFGYVGSFLERKKNAVLPMLACQCHKASGRSLTMVTFDNKSSLGCSAMSFGRPLKLLDGFFAANIVFFFVTCRVNYIYIIIYTLSYILNINYMYIYRPETPMTSMLIKVNTRKIKKNKAFSKQNTSPRVIWLLRIYTLAWHPNDLFLETILSVVCPPGECVELSWSNGSIHS